MSIVLIPFHTSIWPYLFFSPVCLFSAFSISQNIAQHVCFYSIASWRISWDHVAMRTTSLWLDTALRSPKLCQGISLIKGTCKYFTFDYITFSNCTKCLNKKNTNKLKEGNTFVFSFWGFLVVCIILGPSNKDLSSNYLICIEHFVHGNNKRQLCCLTLK